MYYKSWPTPISEKISSWIAVVTATASCRINKNFQNKNNSLKYQKLLIIYSYTIDFQHYRTITNSNSYGLKIENLELKNEPKT